MPYYKVSRINNHPFKVHIFEDKVVLENDEHTEIALNTITACAYVEDPLNYGIQLSTQSTTYFLPFFFKEDFEKMRELLHLK